MEPRFKIFGMLVHLNALDIPVKFYDKVVGRSCRSQDENKVAFFGCGCSG